MDVGVGGWVSNSALASCRAAVTVRIPPSLNEPPIRVLRVPNGGVAVRFLRNHSVFRCFDSMNLLQMTRCGTLYCRRRPTRKRVTWIQSS